MSYLGVVTIVIPALLTVKSVKQKLTVLSLQSPAKVHRFRNYRTRSTLHRDMELNWTQADLYEVQLDSVLVDLCENELHFWQNIQYCAYRQTPLRVLLIKNIEVICVFVTGLCILYGEAFHFASKLSQAIRAAACLSMGQNITAKSVHLTSLYPASIVSSTGFCAIIWLIDWSYGVDVDKWLFECFTSLCLYLLQNYAAFMR